MPELPTAVKSNAAKMAAKEKLLAEAKEERIARNPLQIKKDYGKGSAVARKRTQKVNASMDRHLHGGGVVDGSSELVVSEAHVYISKVLPSRHHTLPVSRSVDTRDYSTTRYYNPQY
jgi:hypothetical protein